MITMLGKRYPCKINYQPVHVKNKMTRVKCLRKKRDGMADQVKILVPPVSVPLNPDNITDMPSEKYLADILSVEINMLIIIFMEISLSATS